MAIGDWVFGYFASPIASLQILDILPLNTVKTLYLQYPFRAQPRLNIGEFHEWGAGWKVCEGQMTRVRINGA